MYVFVTCSPFVLGFTVCQHPIDSPLEPIRPTVPLQFSTPVMFPFLMQSRSHTNTRPTQPTTFSNISGRGGAGPSTCAVVASLSPAHTIWSGCSQTWCLVKGILPNSGTYLNQTPIFGRCRCKDGHQKDMCLWEIGLCVQNLSIILGSILNQFFLLRDLCGLLMARCQWT